MANFHQVEERLGKGTVKLLLDSARNGDISNDQMECIAELLGRQPGEPNNVFGRHRQRMEDYKDKEKHAMLKYILCDWWQVHLFELTSEKALEKIVKVCQDSNVALLPLAKALKGTRYAQVQLKQFISFSFEQLLKQVLHNYWEEGENDKDTLPSTAPGVN